LAPSMNESLNKMLLSLLSESRIMILCIALYLAAKRKLPAAWALASATIGLILAGHSWLSALLPASFKANNWNTLFFDSLPIALIIFIACLAFLYAYRRFQTFGAFWEAAKKFTRRTQMDIGE
jgi:hypothetical protein